MIRRALDVRSHAYPCIYAYTHRLLDLPPCCCGYVTCFSIKYFTWGDGMDEGVSRVGRRRRVVRVFNVKCVAFLFAPRPRGGTTRGSIRDGFGSSCRPCRRVYVPAGRGSAAEPGARTWSPCRVGRRPCSTRNTGTCTRVARPGGLHHRIWPPARFPLDVRRVDWFAVCSPCRAM